MPVSHESAQLALARISLADQRSLRQALRETTRTTAAAMAVERISIWLFMPGSQVIRCEYLHQPGQPDASEGTLLHREHFPQYFSAIERQRAVPVADMSHPAILQEFLAPYMQPLGITAMLDAPIYRSGDVIGIVCHEQCSQPREWTAADVQLAASTADTVARLYEEAARQQAELMLHSHEIHAQALEQAANIGRMAAGVAHDFNNILHAILAWGDLLRSHLDEDRDAIMLLDKQLEAIELGTALSRQLMDIGHHNSSEPMAIDVQAMLQRFLPALRNAAGKGCSVTLDCRTPLSRVFIDEHELQRVLLNLLLNARDAMPGGGTIHLRLYEAPRKGNIDQGPYVTIEVADEGCGMDDATLQQLFQPYFTTKGSNGTGLGMTVVQQVVTFAGGFVDVESQPGCGTRFFIRLPRIGAVNG